MNEPSLLDQLSSRFGDQLVATEVAAIDPWIEVTGGGLVDVCQYLKEDPQWQLDLLNCITAVDYLHTDPKKAAKADWEPHLEVVYHLSSTKTKQTLVLKVKLPRWLNLRDDFTVGAQHQSQYPVGAGMLRTHIDQHFIGANIELDDSLIVLNLGCHRLLSSSPGQGCSCRRVIKS